MALGIRLAALHRETNSTERRYIMVQRYTKTLCAVLPFAGFLWAAPVVSAYEDDYGRYDRGDRYRGEERYDSEDRYGRDQSVANTRMSERDLSSFERYLDTHDEVASTLYQTPDLIN